MTYCLEKLSQDPSSLTDRTSGFVILNFTDMIGDGPDKTQWRTGGLKMGGTYWYYVRLTCQDPSSLTDRTSGFVILNCGQRMEISIAFWGHSQYEPVPDTGKDAIPLRI
jgi:hypothetical protein